MTKTIIDLWNGNIAPCDHCGAHDAEAGQLLCLMERHRETLQKGLTAAQTETLQKYIDCSEEYLLRMMELAFCDGFCIGEKLAVETIL